MKHFCTFNNPGNNPFSKDLAKWFAWFSYKMDILKNRNLLTILQNRLFPDVLNIRKFVMREFHYAALERFSTYYTLLNISLINIFLLFISNQFFAWFQTIQPKFFFTLSKMSVQKCFFF